ncbi:hypothetical protein VNO77_44589 [Canavalia gladiata]|uniref:Uncharacterized protein n=1 Tax=Canavalia gladiata TaxID=3824 RepID=A0AAN9JZ85_CANGL
MIVKVVSEGSGDFDYDCLKEMRFLKATLCEAMRLYPPVAWDSKHAACADVLPDGTCVRKRDRGTYFPYGMRRMEVLMGKNCEEFRPDRWVHEPAEDNGTLKFVSPLQVPRFSGRSESVSWEGDGFHSNGICRGLYSRPVSN